MYPGQRFNAYSHLVGFFLALGGGALLLRNILPRGDVQQVAAALVFALSVVVLYGASTATHTVRGRTRVFWQRLDHCAIYLLIAGTYTPFALTAPLSLLSTALLVCIWGLFGLGVWMALRAQSGDSPPVALYVAMGWICVVGALWGGRQLSASAVAWLLAGAGCYTLGTVFYRNRRGIKHAHGIWHLFVLAGTTAHYLAIGLYVF
jgi:hemolysin III